MSDLIFVPTEEFDKLVSKGEGVEIIDEFGIRSLLIQGIIIKIRDISKEDYNRANNIQ